MSLDNLKKFKELIENDSALKNEIVAATKNAKSREEAIEATLPIAEKIGLPLPKTMLKNFSRSLMRNSTKLQAVLGAIIFTTPKQFITLAALQPIGQKIRFILINSSGKITKTLQISIKMTPQLSSSIITYTARHQKT